MKGFIVYSTYTTGNNKTFIHLYGRLENKQSFLAIKPFKPYFFIKEKNVKKIKKNEAEIEKTSFTNFKGEKLVKLNFNTQPELTKIYQKIHKKIDTYEADIRPHYKFVIDNNLLGSLEIDGDYITSEKVERIYQNPEVKPSDWKPKLKLASIDIEADNRGRLFCIGITSENYKKNFFIGKHDLKNAISCKDEEECLLKFKQALIELDPDVITGWNVIDFDLQYIRSLFQKNKIPFDIGRNNDNVKLRIESGFFRSSSADIPGRQILDGLNLVRDPFIKEAPTIKNAEFESYSLEDVAQSLLKTGKLIKGKGKERHEEIEKLYNSGKKEDHQHLVNYNLLDCELAYDIIEKTKILDLAIERSQLTGMPLDRITSSIASFDSLYIRKAHSRNLASPTIEFGNKEERITGGYVYSPKPGIYNNVLILDFKSLYPSIIKTFNIDPYSYLEKKEKNSIESPNKAYFKNTNGILPEIITTLHEAREKAKKEGREFSSYAIKIIMNSFFGVLASPNCRYFNLKIANAITHFGQFIIKLTAQEIEKLGYKVIYSDTDSVFVETGLNKEKANKLGKEIPDHINNFYNKYVKENYKRESFLELEFEKLYLSLLIPQIRGQGKAKEKVEGENKEVKAAKKRYAGLIEKNGKEEIEIVGLEAIRGDWTEAAQKFQKELLLKVFKKQQINEFIKEYIKKILFGELDKQLIYKKSIRKNLDEYTKTTPPHVKAARKLEKLDSNIIEYYMTTDGPEPIQNKKHKIDYKHYIEKQIKPIANQVLTLFNQDFDDIIKGSKQKTLF